jgi:hypothetical protein
MKRIAPYLLLLLATIFFSCKKENKSPEKNAVSEDIVLKLKNAGFDTSEGLMKYREGYLVEYDIFLTLDQINGLAEEKDGRKPAVEHYRTNNLVTSPRAINVFMDAGFGSYLQSSFDAALARYNALNLGLSFQRTTNASIADISILSFYEVSNVLGFSAGFPSGGNPASPIRLNTYYYNNSTARPDATTTIAHEIGHAIGYRHTDFMNRTFSCGIGGNEGDGGVGAVPINGTPTDPSANSWMLACSSNTDRPFTLLDRVALLTVYPGNHPGDPAPVGKIISLRAAINNQYVCAENAGASPLIANRPTVGPWEKFRVIDLGGGLIALQATINNSYVCVEYAGVNPLIANRTAVNDWERFRWINNADGTISLQSVINNSYVVAENAGSGQLYANRDAINEWERFYWQEEQP